MMTIYVGNLPYSFDEAKIRQLFEPYGEVLSVKLVTDRETGRFRGFGFVDMKEKEGSVAINALNGKEFEGRALRVNEAREKEQQRPNKSFHRW